MTAQLFLMRHGPAEDESPSGSDFDRALTTAGIAAVLRVLKSFSDRGFAPTRILSSPLVRAKQTADLVSDHFSIPVEIEKALSTEGDALPLIQLLEQKKSGAVMLVGHEPDLTELAFALARQSVIFGRGTIASFELGQSTKLGTVFHA